MIMKCGEDRQDERAAEGEREGELLSAKGDSLIQPLPRKRLEWNTEFSDYEPKCKRARHVSGRLRLDVCQNPDCTKRKTGLDRTVATPSEGLAPLRKARVSEGLGGER
ncbi:hypothetical protein AOLI_G00081500 [Acnodon oligacanthus]